MLEQIHTLLPNHRAALVLPPPPAPYQPPCTGPSGPVVCMCAGGTLVREVHSGVRGTLINRGGGAAQRPAVQIQWA